MKTKKRISIVSVLMAFVLLMSMLVGGSALAEEGDNTLILAGDYGSPMNPVLHNTADIQSVIFSGLMKLNSENQPILDLAESYEYDEENMTYTFKLRDGIKWHDGTDFTADDAVFTYTVLTTDDTISSDIISNYTDIKAVSAPDATTFVVEMKEPNMAMPAYFTIGIIPKHLLEGKDISTDEFNQHPVGTGRYKFVSKDPASNSVILEANEDYYDKIPNIKTLVFKDIPDENTKATMMQAGEADIAWLNANYAATFDGKEGYQITKHNCCDFRGVMIRSNEGFWKDNSDSAYALNYALDKEAILAATVAGQGIVAYSPLQKTNLGGNTEADIFTYDLDKFASEMEKLGWTKGDDGIYERNGQRFSFTLMAPETEVERVDMAMLVSNQLKQAGVEVVVDVKSSWDWSDDDAYLVGEAFIFDADQSYSYFTSSGSSNGTGYSDSKIDELLTEARHETDAEKREELYGEFEVEQALNPRVIMLNFLDAFYVSTDRLHGIDENKILGHHSRGMLWNIEEWYLD